MAWFEDDSAVCAHAGCSCEPRLGSRYCGDYCEHLESFVERRCGCDHDGCGAEAIPAEEPGLAPQPA